MLARVDTSAGDEREHLEAELIRLKAEAGRLVGLVRKGSASAAEAVMEAEAEMRRIQERLNALKAPRAQAPDRKMFRAALEQKTPEWKDVLRGEPRLARMLLRRLVGPLQLWQDERVDPKHRIPAVRALGLQGRFRVQFKAEVKVAKELGQPLPSHFRNASATLKSARSTAATSSRVRSWDERSSPRSAATCAFHKRIARASLDGPFERR